VQALALGAFAEVAMGERVPARGFPKMQSAGDYLQAVAVAVHDHDHVYVYVYVHVHNPARRPGGGADAWAVVNVNALGDVNGDVADSNGFEDTP
jgi:hypothetical protein